jgi:hypothetical protein
MVIRISIQVSLDIANKLHQRSSISDGELAEILNVERNFNLIIKPLHPGAKDPNLIRHFIVEVPDKATVELVVDSLLQSKHVEAAYIKPPVKPA